MWDTVFSTSNCYFNLRSFPHIAGQIASLYPHFCCALGITDLGTGSQFECGNCLFEVCIVYSINEQLSIIITR